jgi:hypothetical protein
VAVNAVVLKVLGKELVETEDFGVGPHVSVVPRELMIRLSAKCGLEKISVWVQDRQLSEKLLGLLARLALIEKRAGTSKRSCDDRLKFDDRLMCDSN